MGEMDNEPSVVELIERRYAVWKWRKLIAWLLLLPWFVLVAMAPGYSMDQFSVPVILLSILGSVLSGLVTSVDVITAADKRAFAVAVALLRARPDQRLTVAESLVLLKRLPVWLNAGGGPAFTAALEELLTQVLQIVAGTGGSIPAASILLIYRRMPKFHRELQIACVEFAVKTHDLAAKPFLEKVLSSARAEPDVLVAARQALDMLNAVA